MVGRSGGPGAGRDVLLKEPFWGAISATIDWCEENYVFEYVAEFWNTLTNFLMLLLVLYGIFQMWKIGNIEKRYYISHLGLAIVAIGSTAFHGSLRYDMQLLDELPMVYSAACLIYCLFEDDPKDKHKKWLPAFLLFACAAITYVYVFVWKNPLVHEVFYGFMILSIVVKAYLLAREHDDSKTKFIYTRTFFFCTSMFVLAWVLWNIDNHFCTELREIRSHMGALAPLLELHGWWHILTGCSSYALVLFSVVVRQRILGYDAALGFHFGCIPYIISKTRMRAPVKGQ